MPDEGNVRYGISDGYFCSDGKYMFAGSVSEFDVTTSADDGIPVYESIRALMEPAEPVTICFKLPWWYDPYAYACKVLGFDVPLERRPKYNVRTLRKGSKSHRGKHA